MTEKSGVSLLESKRKLIHLAWRVFFLLASLEGFAALVFLFNTPSESNQSSLFGISGLRLAIILGMLALSLTPALFFIYSLFVPGRFNQRFERMTERFDSPRLWAISFLVSVLAFLVGCFFITLTPEVSEPFTRAYFDRLLPTVGWLAFVSAQATLSLLLVRFGSKPFSWLPKSKPFYISIFVFGIFYLGWISIAPSLLLIETQITGWNIATAPILDTQLFIAWIAGMLMFIGWVSLLANDPVISRKRLFFIHWIDIFVFLVFWILSIIIWQRLPIHANWFVSEPSPPNQEFYPSSDARVYDITAQAALIGRGFKFFGSSFIRRPLHAAYLTILHWIVGQNYESVVSLQVLILALLPPLIYLLTKSLHDRPSGVIAATLVMLREANSISISGRITTSHAKELLVDLPTTLGMVIFTLVVILWFKQFKQRRLLALVSGGVLGAILLIRFEMVVALIIISAAAYAVSRSGKHTLTWLKSMLLFLLGMGLVVSPWIYRNWKLTGLFFIDSPFWRADLIQQRFRPYPQSTPAISVPDSFPSEALPSMVAPIQTAVSQPSATPTLVEMQPTPQNEVSAFETETARALRFVAMHPGQVAGFIVTHYLNSQMQTFLILPTSIRILDSFTAFLGHHSLQRFWYGCCSALDYIRRMPYWHKWDGKIPKQAIVPFTINLILIASGIHVTWKKHRWIGLTPGMISIAHFLFNAVFRNSGGRYILPVDWVGIIYFSIGLSLISTRFLGFFLGSTHREKWKEEHANRTRNSSGKQNLLLTPGFYLIVGLLLTTGLAVPITEKAFKPLYGEVRENEMLSALLQTPRLSPAERQYIMEFLAQGGDVIVGRGLYPEYLPAYTEDVAKYKYLPAPYPRLSFYVAGMESMTILMPVNTRPKFFPNSAEVVVLGCPIQMIPQGNKILNVLVVGIFGPSGTLEAIVSRFPIPIEPACPLPSPPSPEAGDTP